MFEKNGPMQRLETWLDTNPNRSANISRENGKWVITAKFANIFKMIFVNDSFSLAVTALVEEYGE